MTLKLFMHFHKYMTKKIFTTSVWAVLFWPRGRVYSFQPLKLLSHFLPLDIPLLRRPFLTLVEWLGCNKPTLIMTYFILRKPRRVQNARHALKKWKSKVSDRPVTESHSLSRPFPRDLAWPYNLHKPCILILLKTKICFQPVGQTAFY